MRRLLLIVGLCFCLIAGSKNRSPLEQAPAKETARLNPFEGEARAVLAGQKLYRRECAGCHGRDAQGSGRAPALVSAALRRSPPGALLWVLRNGSLRHGMPSFSHLPEPQRWQIVSYLKTL